jgi:hypothetical protein
MIAAGSGSKQLTTDVGSYITRFQCLQTSIGLVEMPNTRGKRSDPHPVALLGLDGSYPASTAALVL